MSAFYSAIIDATTSALLVLSRYPPVILFLSKALTEVEQVFNVNYPYYLEKFPLATVNPLSYPWWMWDEKMRRFVPTPENLLTDKLKWKSALAVKKASTFSEIARAITFMRYRVTSGLTMQDTVYMVKRLQAQRFKDKKYPRKEILQYPYVLQYADVSGLTLKAAADEILFKAQLEDEELAKSEFLRLKYFNLIKKAEDLDEIEVAMQEFIKGI